MGDTLTLATNRRIDRGTLRSAKAVGGWLAFAAGVVALCVLTAQAAPENASDNLTAAAASAEPAPAPQAASPAAAPSPADDEGGALLPRLREGTQLTDRLGRFKQESESLTFIDEEGRELGGLPNLGLERIIRALKGVEEPESVWWSVSGTVTEFSGRNYLLISRAVFKAATLPPAPESVGN